jgi:hypothetical protein
MRARPTVTVGVVEIGRTSHNEMQVPEVVPFIWSPLVIISVNDEFLRSTTPQ